MTDTKAISPNWEFIADTVMGGVSTGTVITTILNNRTAARLTGDVSLDQDGGFVQMAFDLTESGIPFDASVWAGIELDVLGNGEVYELRLRTTRLSRPWQSYRTEFSTSAEWTTVRLPFETFEAHRHDVRFDAAKLCRIGVLAIGREFHADVAVSGLRFYR